MIKRLLRKWLLFVLTEDEPANPFQTERVVTTYFISYQFFVGEHANSKELARGGVGNTTLPVLDGIDSPEKVQAVQNILALNIAHNNRVTTARVVLLNFIPIAEHDYPATDPRPE